MPSPLDALRKAQTIGANPDPELEGWRGYADSALSGLVGGFKGLTGLGDQGPAGATSTNAGALLGAAMPFMGRLGSLKQLVRSKLGLEAPAAVGAEGTGSIFEGLEKGARRALIDRWQQQPRTPPDVPAEMLTKFIKPSSKIP